MSFHSPTEGPSPASSPLEVVDGAVSPYRPRVKLTTDTTEIIDLTGDSDDKKAAESTRPPKKRKATARMSTGSKPPRRMSTAGKASQQ